MLQPGQVAPNFSCVDADMELIKLADYKGLANVVLYFYKRDSAPSCLQENIEFSDLATDFAAHDTVLLGVSRDDCLSHAAFRDQHGINTRLLADKDAVVCHKYCILHDRIIDGVSRKSALRSTFIIDKQGVVRHALYDVASKGHAQQVLALVKQL